MQSNAAKQEQPSDFRPLWREAELAVADALGHLMVFWGFKRHVGRIWAVLYLSPYPLTTVALAETLGISQSAVSVSLAELLRWGAVKKTWLRGDRRDFYEVEPRIWKLVRRVLERRELNLITETADVLSRAQRSLDGIGPTANEADQARIDYMRRRLAKLSSLTKVGHRLVRALLQGRAVNGKDVQAVMESQP